jgi:hypothetical protein
VREFVNLINASLSWHGDVKKTCPKLFHFWLQQQKEWISFINKFKRGKQYLLVTVKFLRYFIVEQLHSQSSYVGLRNEDIKNVKEL